MSKSENRNSGRREIPVKQVSEFSLTDDELRHHRIAEKAYELYQCRGYYHGRDLDDWLEAERLVLAAAKLESDKTAHRPQNKARKAK